MIWYFSLFFSQGEKSKSGLEGVKSLILINKIGNYSFAYESGSLDTYVSGSQVTNAAGGPIRLDINPIAWISKGGVAGDITFVYTGR